MVTGANAGMGKEISLALAGKGANLVMVSRDPGRGEAARADVQHKTGNAAVELMIADLSSQQSIRKLVKMKQVVAEVCEVKPHLDKAQVLNGARWLKEKGFLKATGA